MTDIAVTSQIVQALATYLKRDPSSITESHHLRDDLGLDSVAIIELLFEIEDRFKIQIPDQDLPGLNTVGSVADYVQQQLVSGKPSPKSDATPAAAPKKSAASKKLAAKMKKPAAAAKKAPLPKKQAPVSKKAVASKKTGAPLKASPSKKSAAPKKSAVSKKSVAPKKTKR